MESNNLILTIDYLDGSKGKRELISIFSAPNEKEYAALLPLNDDETSIEGASIELLRAKKFINDDNEEDYFIEGIDSEEELKVATESFENLLDENDTSDEELQVISFTNDRGEVEDWKVIDVFECNNRKYIALIPVDNNESEIDNINIYLMRLELIVQGGVEGCEVTPILSDMEYDDVISEFEKRVNNS